MTPKLTPVFEFLHSLTGRSDLIQLKDLLLKANVTPDDLSEYRIFNDSHYSRNKIAGSEWFDLYLMCWKPGQRSTIHDHTDSSCAFKILQGTATEIGCELVNAEKKYVHIKSEAHYPAGSCCVAQDGEIHQICNLSAEDNLITLHVYSPPLKMSVYEIDPGESEIRLAV